MNFILAFSDAFVSPINTIICNARGEGGGNGGVGRISAESILTLNRELIHFGSFGKRFRGKESIDDTNRFIPYCNES